jgi:hypothetical protein
LVYKNLYGQTWWFLCIIPAVQEAEAGGLWPAQAKLARFCFNNNRKRLRVSMAQVAENKGMALDLIPNTSKKLYKIYEG